MAPASGTTGVALTTAITGTASEPLNASTLNSATFILAEVGGGTVNGTITVNGAVATFTPDFPLTQNTQYMATLTTGAATVSGKSLSNNLSQSFTTVGVPGAPTILSVSAVTGSPRQVRITLAPNTPTGGAAITGYTVSPNPAAGGITDNSVPATNLTRDIGGLNPATAYLFTVTATNIAGTGPPSAPFPFSVTPTGDTPPGPVAFGTSVPGDGQVTVNFNPPVAPNPLPVNSYTVTALTAGGVSTGISASGAGTSIVVTGLTNGTPYRFRVVAFNTAGAGTAADTAGTFTPAGAPSAPTNVSASASNPGVVACGTTTTALIGPVTVDFVGVGSASTGGSPISDYTVTPTPGGAGIVVSPAGGTSTSRTVTGLTVCTPYTFTVTATNGGALPLAPAVPRTSGPSTASNSVTPTPSTSAPTVAPGSPAAIAGNASASVSFTTVTGAIPTGNSPIIDYTVTSNAGHTASGNGTPIVVNGLTNGTAYTFTVRARNANGFGPASSTTSVTPAAPPGAPTAVSALAGNLQATVSFLAPVDTGGRPIIPNGYTVTSNTGVTATGSGSPIVVPGLSNGTSYTFTVTATNAGTLPSPPGVPLTSVPSTPSAPPTTLVGLAADAPTIVSATNTTSTPNLNNLATEATGGRVDVAFNAPANPGGSAITSYTATSSPGGFTNLPGPPVSPIAVLGLALGQPYTFTVTANNLAGASLPSAPSLPVTPATVPGAPTAVSATVASTTQVTVSFAPPLSSGGAAISNYLVAAFLSPGGAATLFSATGSASPITVGSLTPGTSYFFRVTAFNSIGASVPSADSASVAPSALPAPTAPTIFSASAAAPFTPTPNQPVGSTAPGNTARVTVDAPTAFLAPCALPGCSPITTYTVTSSGGQSVTGPGTPGPPANRFFIDVPGLTIGTAYTFTVIANNSIGPGAVSGASAQVTPATVPGKPLQPNVTAGPANVSVSFTPLSAAANGGSAITNYTVTAYIFPCGACNVPVHTVSGSASPIEVGAPAVPGGLSNSNQYVFRVEATNSVGAGVRSDTSIIVQPDAVATVPTAPTAVTAANSGIVGGFGVATVSYTPTPVANNGGNVIVGYVITANPSAGVVIPNQSGCDPSPTPSPCPSGATVSRNVSGLTVGVAYTFTVVAVNGIGQSAASGASNSVTPARAPNAPTDPFTLTPGLTQVSVAFTPTPNTAPSNGGANITGYTVTYVPTLGGAPATLTGPASPIVITGLAPNTSYNFSLTATNAGPLVNGIPAGAPLTSSSISLGSRSTTGALAPAKPTGVTAARLSSGRARVSLTVPAAAAPSLCVLPACSPITSYRATATPNGAFADSITGPFTAGQVINIDVLGLNNGTGYTFTVIATNSIGTSPPSDPTAPAVTPIGLADAPTGVVATAGNLQAIVSFTAPANTGGSPIFGYRVFCVGGAPACPAPFTDSVGTGTSVTVGGLSAPPTMTTPYTFRVSALTDGGVLLGNLSAVSNPVTPTNAPVVAACNTGAGVASPSGVVTLRAQASRGTGVSPLSVFFDATATTATGIARPYHDLEYRWNFGDPAGDQASAPNNTTWSRGTRPGLISKNLALGPVAGHVFEPAPGSGTQTYTVVLSATSDNTPANTASCSIPISVTDPDAVFATTSTVCISGVTVPVPGSADGCPAGAAVLQNVDFDAAVATAIAAGRRRILFRRGETYNASPGAQIRVTGPGIVGAYGTGTKPRVAATANNMQIFSLSSNSTPTISDWRIMDLELDGLAGTTAAANRNLGLYSAGSYSQFTFLRLDIHDVNFAYQASSSVLDSINNPTRTSPIWDQVTFVDSTFQRILGGAGNGGNGIIFSARRFTFLGNLINDTTNAEHGLRNQYMGKGVISNNTTRNVARLGLTLRGITFAGTASHDPGQFSEHHVVSDNLLEGCSINPVNAGDCTQLASTGPQFPGVDERIRHAIWERNWFVARTTPNGAATGVAMLVQASEVTLRNNVFEASGTPGLTAINVQHDDGNIPFPDRVSILNNTFFRGTGGTLFAITFNHGTNHRVHNNLARAPNGSTVSTFFASNAAITLTASNNSTDVQFETVDPLFVGGTPTDANRWRLNAGSYATSAPGGVPVAVHSDFFTTPRPIGAVIDLGATEQ